MRDRKGVINTEEEIKKALHEQIDEMKIPDLEVESIRVVVVFKKSKRKQGTDKPKK